MEILELVSYIVVRGMDAMTPEQRTYAAWALILVPAGIAVAVCLHGLKLVDARAYHDAPSDDRWAPEYVLRLNWEREKYMLEHPTKEVGISGRLKTWLYGDES